MYQETLNKTISYSGTITVNTMTEKHTIYIAGRITGGRKYADLYLRIVEQLKTYGKVLTEHVANPTVEAGEIKLKIFFTVIECIQSIWIKYGKCGLIRFTFADEDNAGLTDVFIHDRDMDWLYECDGNICKREKKPKLMRDHSSKVLKL